ncbi:hypothetical protein MPER_03159, partial [Moniliophthora perniciosa FA553]
MVKRASVDDMATIGYATGTTGGSGGTQTTVTTLEELTAAVQGDAAKVVIVYGTITGNGVVQVGPNTSVIGAAGSSYAGDPVLESCPGTTYILRHLFETPYLAIPFAGTPTTLH